MNRLLALMIPALAFAQLPERIIALEGDTFHVQGLIVEEGERFFVTSVDRAAQKGFLFEYNSTGQRLRAVELQQGAMYHPGGFDSDETTFWIPVAEYRASSKSVVQRRSKTTLEVVSSFELADHIGALAVASDRLFLANWDARKVYEYTFEGTQIRVRDNPTAYRVQDWKYRYGALVGAAVAPRASSDHAVVWFDPETLQPMMQFLVKTTDRGVALTNEGFDSRSGQLYFLPEDTPSRIFVFAALDFQPAAETAPPLR